jgi:hypothetical protein
MPLELGVFVGRQLAFDKVGQQPRDIGASSVHRPILAHFVYFVLRTFVAFVPFVPQKS